MDFMKDENMGASLTSIYSAGAKQKPLAIYGAVY